MAKYKLAYQAIEKGLKDLGMDITDRLVAIGMLDPAMKDNPRSTATQLGKYREAMKTPAFQERELNALRNNFETGFTPADIGERTIIQPEDMVGNVLIANRGDPSNLGLLSMVGGQQVDVPVQAGYKFSQQNAGQGLGWASNLGVARGAHNRLRKAAEDYDMPVLAVYNRMGRESTNFSTPIADAMQQQIGRLPIKKADKAQFDAELRAQYPEWVGLDDPRALDQLMGEGEFAGKTPGQMRTAYTTIMGKQGYQQKGFPTYKEALDAANIEELTSQPFGASGISMYRPDTDAAVRPIDFHRSYDTGMPGQYTGGLQESVPFRVMFPDIYNRLRTEMTKPASGRAPAPLTNEQAIVAANIRGDNVGQVANQRWLDNIRTYLETGKSLYSTPTGGLLSAAARDFQSEVDRPQLLAGSEISPMERRELEIDQQMRDLGVDPRELAAWEYGSILPIAKSKVTGERRLAMPTVGRDVLRGLLDLAGTPRRLSQRPQLQGLVPEEYFYNPRAAMDVLL